MGQKCRKYRRDRKNKIIEAPSKDRDGKPCNTSGKKQTKDNENQNDDTTEKVFSPVREPTKTRMNFSK